MRERRVILLCLVLLATTTTPARADDQFRIRPTAGGPPLLEASGEGSVSVPPDLATFSLGVVTQAATAREAAEENARKMTAVVQALARQVPGRPGRGQSHR